MEMPEMLVTVHTDKHAQTLIDIAVAIRDHPREGSDIDNPEGARSIRISDTLADHISKSILAMVEVEGIK